MTGLLLLIALVQAATPAAPAQDRLTGLSPIQSVALDPTLQEVSGLAAAGPDSLFAHNDEHAIIHEIRHRDGVSIRAFALGKPTLAGDFEATALINGALYLASSEGRIFEAAPAAHRARAKFNVYDSGAGDHCEIEGLAPGRSARDLLLLCKAQHDARERGRLQVYAWSLDTPLAPARRVIDKPYTDLVSDAEAADFRPSDLAHDKATGDLFILNAAGGVLQLDARADPVSYFPLDRKRHPQPEGLALVSGGFAIADEGKDKPARLTIYRRR